jgi:hypothetical protein
MTKRENFLSAMLVSAVIAAVVLSQVAYRWGRLEARPKAAAPIAAVPQPKKKPAWMGGLIRRSEFESVVIQTFFAEREMDRGMTNYSLADLQAYAWKDYTNRWAEMKQRPRDDE